MTGTTLTLGAPVIAGHSMKKDAELWGLAAKGAQFASAGDDGQISIWNSSGLQRTVTLEGKYRTVDFWNGGLVTGSEDGSVTLLDLELNILDTVKVSKKGVTQVKVLLTTYPGFDNK